MLTTFNEVDLKSVSEIRARYKDSYEKAHGVKLGFMSFFVKATIEALKKYPIVNASVDGQDIVYHSYYDLGIAVSSPRRLVVPVLRDVAQPLGMPESPVGRVVNTKDMPPPQGVFELKYFFHSGISSSYGESVSSVTIKQRIRKIIENEDPRKPLSDSKIVGILQREGLVLARRTIAKYRQELTISTSNQRTVLY